MWNYRIIRSFCNNEEQHAIHEVYYTENGEIDAISADPVKPYGETADDLRLDLERMLKAFDKRVLEQGSHWRPVLTQPKHTNVLLMPRPYCDDANIDESAS